MSNVFIPHTYVFLQDYGHLPFSDIVVAATLRECQCSSHGMTGGEATLCLGVKKKSGGQGPRNISLILIQSLWVGQLSRPNGLLAWFALTCSHG